MSAFNFSRWLKSLSAQAPHKPIRKRQSPTLQVESLEDRLVPAITLLTDRAEYQAGETVGIIAAGVAAGSAVEFRVFAAGTSPGSAPGLITDGGTGDLDGAADGSVRLAWSVDSEIPPGTAFTVTVADVATGETQSSGFTVIAAEPQTSAPQFVQTDKDDYQPGETAQITADGFTPGETIEFLVEHIDGTPNTGGGHTPWQVADGGAGDLDGVVDGSVLTTWYVDPDDSLGAVFSLSAQSLASGASAYHIFTDSGVTSLVSVANGRPDPAYTSSVAAPFGGSARAAFNGGFWVSGAFATQAQPQWIEVDLGKSYPIGQLALTVEQSPNGTTTHEVWVKSTPIGNNVSGATRIVNRTSSTFDGQRLVLTPSTPTSGRYVQIRTVSSPSWVAWGLISVYGVNDHPTVSLSGSSGDVLITANPSFTWVADDSPPWDLASISYQLKRNGITLETPLTTASKTLNLAGYGPGQYEITVTAVDAAGATTATATRTANVIALPPVVSLSGPTGNVLSNTNPAFTWSVADGDGNLTSASVTVTKAGQTDPVYTRNYTTTVPTTSLNLKPYGLGSYTITVTGTDARGDDDSDTLIVNVLNSPPTAVFTVTTPPAGRLEGSAIAFDASGSTDFDEHALTSYVWNYGDGTLATGPTTSHTYTDNGSYQVSLTVVDALGDISVVTQSVAVGNVAPTLTATSPASVNEAAPFELSLATSDTGRDVTSIVVDWGDGTTETFASDGVKQHVYLDGGLRRTVRVSLTDEDGTYPDLYVADVDVRNAAPVVSLAPFFTAQAGASTFLTATVIDGSNDSLSYAWDFGDGASQSGSGLDAVWHEYAADGVYPISLTVTDSDGLSTTVASQAVIGTPVSFTTAAQTVGEGGIRTITARLDNGIAVGHEVIVPLVVSGVSPSDYSLSAGQIVIAAGQLTGSVSLAAREDVLDEDDEELVVRMGLTTGGSHGEVAEQRITVVDNDAKPTVFFTSKSRSVDEGAGTLVLTAGLSAVSGRDVVVPLSFGGTAVAGEDYKHPDQLQIVVPAGALSGSLELELTDDTRIEGAETILVTMLPSGQATLSAEAGRPTAVSFIVPQNDAPAVSLDSAYRLTAEGVPSIFIRARLSRISEERITVPFAISDLSTARNGLDYQIAPASLSLVFAPGADEASAMVAITDDLLVEGTENILIELSAPSNATLGVSQMVLTDILDNDIVRVSFEAGDVTEWEGGVVPVKVTLSNTSTKTTTVPLVVTGTAKDGSDYTLGAAQLVLQPDFTEGVVYLTLTDDAANEPLEWLYVSFGTIVGGVPGEHTTKSVTIRDNDPLVSISASSGSVGEGAGTTRLAVSLSAPTNRAVTVPLQHGAHRGTDYTGPLSVVIPEGLTSADFTLSITDDATVEPTETIDIALGAPTGGVLGWPNTVSLLLQDNDRPTLYWSSPTYAAQEEQRVVVLSVVLSQPAFTDVVVQVGYTPVEAQHGSDYTTPSSTVTIPQGKTTGTLTVVLVDDEIKEAAESFHVTMWVATGADLPAEPESRRALVGLTDVDKLTYADLVMAAMESAVASSLMYIGGPIQADDATTEAELVKAFKNYLGDHPQVREGLEWVGVVAEAVGSEYITDLLKEFGGTGALIGVDLAAWGYGYLSERYPDGNGWIDWRAFEDHRQDDYHGWVREIGFYLAREGAKFAAAMLIQSLIPIPGAGTLIVGVGEKLNEQWGVDEHFEAGRENVEDVLTGKKEVKVAGVKVSKGPGDGATLFFDTDFDGIRSESEPYGVTTPDGNALVFGVETADVNEDSILGIDEGQWVATGGTDASVNLPFRMPLVAPADHRIVSAASTLVSKLVQIEAFPRTGEGLRAAEQQFSAAFGLSPQPWAAWDFIEEAAAGNTAAAALFGKENQFYITVGMVASFFEGRSAGLSFDFLADIAVEDIAHKITTPDAALDLTREAVVANVLRGVAVRTGLTVSDAEITALSRAVAQANRLIGQIPVEGSRAYLDAVVRVHRVAQGEFATTLAQFGRGEVTAAGLQAATAGLPSAVAAAPVFNIQPVYLAAFTASVVEGDSGESYLEFLVAPLTTPALPVSVSFRTADGTARSGQDYVAEAGTLTWAAGDDTPRTVQVRVLGDVATESDETVILLLSDAVNATILSGAAKGRIVNDDHFSYASAAGVDEVLALSVSGAAVILERDGVVVFDGSFGSGGRIDLSGQAGDRLTLFAGASSITQTIGLDGGRTIEIGGHTIRVDGIGQLSDELAIDITGVPQYLFEGTPVTLDVGLPASLNPATTTYRWTVSDADGQNPVTAGTGASIEYLPGQENGRVAVTLTDGVRTFTVRREVFVYPPNVAPVATDDAAPTTENAAVTVGVTANDTDLNPGDVLSLVPGSVSLVAMTRDRDGTPIPAGTSSVGHTGNAVVFDPGSDFDFLAADESAAVVIGYSVTDNSVSPLTDTGTLTVTVTGVNDAPTVTATGADVAVNEGDSARNTGTFADADLSDTVTLSASIGTIADNGDGTWSWSFDTSDGPAQSQIVTVTATDTAGAATTTLFDLIVDNVAPTVTLSGPATAVEGQTGHYTFATADPGADTFDIVVTRGGAVGTVSNLTIDAANGAGSFDVAFADGDASSVVSVQVKDSDGAVSNVWSIAVAVANAAPTPSIVNIGAVRQEGTAIALSGSATDPAGTNDTLTYSWAVYKNDSSTAFDGASGVGLRDWSFTPDDNGSYRLVLTVADEDGGSTAVEQTVGVANAAPTPSITSVSANRVEGTSITVTGAATDPAANNDTLSYAWAVYKDGNPSTFAVGGGALTFSFTPDDNGEYVVTLTVSDEDGGSATAATVITVDNVAPTAGASGPALGVRYQSLAFTITAADVPADAATGFAYAINWGDGSPLQTVAATANNGAGVALDHAYTTSGTYTVTVTATDDEGAASTVTTREVVIAAAALIFDPLDPTRTSLAVGGTAGNDVIKLAAGEGGALQVQFGGGAWVTFAALTGGFGRVVVYGGDGDDNINVADAVTVSARLDGGDGNDTLSGGAGNDVLIGGAGNDSLQAVAGDDVLLGGDGNDTLRAGAGNDQLDGGAGDDQLFGAAGGDTLRGGIGNDLLRAGSGTDHVYGEDGNDTLIGGAGADALDGGAGDDRIDGGAGNDQILGGLGNDYVLGGAGDDSIDAGDGDDQVDGGAGSDILVGGGGNDLLIGGAGNDLLIGGLGADALIGNASDDILIGGRTTYDADPVALFQLRDTWNGDGSYQARVAALRSATFAYRLVADQTVLDDGAVDRLTGSAGSDLFFANADGTGTRDEVTDLGGQECAWDLDPIVVP